MCITYILYSKTLDGYYIGYTSDILEERPRKHNSNHKGYTGKVNDWKIVWSKQFETKEEAYRFEPKLKGWKSRKRIEKLINA